MKLFSLHRNRRIAWLAAFAVLSSVLMPALSNAGVGRSSANGLTEICTAYGVRYVLLDQDKTPPIQSKASHGNHCPYCASTNFHALPTAKYTDTFLARFDGETIAIAAQPGIRVALLFSADPRGPPISFL